MALWLGQSHKGPTVKAIAVDRTWNCPQPFPCHIVPQRRPCRKGETMHCAHSSARYHEDLASFEDLLSGLEKGVSTKRGLFTGGTSTISKISKFSRISTKWSDSPLLSRVWGFSRISIFSPISRNGLFCQTEKTLSPIKTFCWTLCVIGNNCALQLLPVGCSLQTVYHARSGMF